VDFQLRILAVDDDPLILTLLEQVFASLGYEVMVANSAASARKIARDFDPDVAVLDVDLGAGPDGFDLATALKTSSPGLAVVFLTNVAEPKLVGKSAKSLPAGAGYLLKSQVRDARALAKVIEQVSKGAGKSHRDDLRLGHSMKALSQSQLQVIKLLAAGKSNEEIAQIRGTTVRAVRFILARAFKALGLPDEGGSERRVQAALEYIRVAGLPK
jgi:DNA-binding NarL/FixJ family response regulator